MGLQLSADEWDIYKRRSGVSGNAKLELRAACSLELRRHLFDFIGQHKLSSCNEKELLTYMQRVAVKGKNPAVHRQEFYSLSQSPNEPLQQYVAKLQAKATHCNFSITCECTKTVSYAEAMVMDQMLVGLHDKGIQGEVLAKDSQLKTFNDRYRYRYLRAPQGFQAAGDAHARAYDDIVVDIPRKAKIVDDTVLWDEDVEQAFSHTVHYIDLCTRNGIVFNPTKFHFVKDTVDFAGFTLTPTGIRPSNQMLSAIADFPLPTDITGARSWFGLINQVAFSLAIAPVMQPFRELLKSWNMVLGRHIDQTI